jgi:hypothetical protein
MSASSSTFPKPLHIPSGTRSVISSSRDNELHRVVYLEVEFRSLVQGDMDMTTYIGRLKHLLDAMRNVSQQVRETS